MPKKKSHITPSRMNLHGIYEEFHERTLDGFPGSEEAKDFVSNYLSFLADNRAVGRGIVFCGPNGTGKTTLGMIILRAALNLEYDVQAASWPLVIEARTQAWQNHEAMLQFRYRILSPDFLQVDDLGKETGAGKDLSTSVLDLVLRRRSMRKLPTIITTNAEPETLRRTYGDSIASLLNGNFDQVIVEGEDMREWEA